MTWTIIILLILTGFIFLILEVLVLPGTNVAGIVGIVLLIIGIWQAYQQHGNTAGHITLAASGVMTGIILYYALKSKTWNKAMLHKNIDGKTNLIDLENIKPGVTGKTISRLAPMGKIVINDVFYEAKTTGEFIDPDTEIEVIRIDQNKILVKQIKS